MDMRRHQNDCQSPNSSLRAMNLHAHVAHHDSVLERHICCSFHPALTREDFAGVRPSNCNIAVNALDEWWTGHIQPSARAQTNLDCQRLESCMFAHYPHTQIFHLSTPPNEQLATKASDPPVNSHNTGYGPDDGQLTMQASVQFQNSQTTVHTANTLALNGPNQPQHTVPLQLHIVHVS